MRPFPVLFGKSSAGYELFDQLTRAGTPVCRLQVGPDELRDRIARRGWQLHLTGDAVRNAAELDGTGFADLLVDTIDQAVPADGRPALARPTENRHRHPARLVEDGTDQIRHMVYG